MTARTRFILSHGVFPWGVLGGAAALVGLMVGISPTDAVGTSPNVYGVIAVGTLTFLIWTAIVGWLVGVIRWELRGDPPGSRPGSSR